jgi:hypothetical protein
MQSTCAIGGLSGCTIFLHIMSQTAQFSEKKKVSKREKCVLIFSTTFPETSLIIRRTEQDMLKKSYWSSCKYLLFLFDFNET